ncbi:MAG: HlyD family efflux transporter periplasmic adaptor subunit [Schleiferiaceae bacterium]|nr:HlyD family efflux transporter periplasmic adaptor subunit [Schleiferiaceae bacterium]
MVLYGGTPILLTALYFIAFAGSGKGMRVSKSKITTAKVVYDDFQDIIAISGIIEPKETFLIDASEGGVVQEIYVEDGIMVKKGDPLIRLTNASMMLDFMNRETQIVEQINNLRSTRINLDQTKRQIEEQIVDIRYQLSEQKRQFAIDTNLFLDEVISETEFKASQAQLHYLEKKMKLLQERHETDEQYRLSQIHRIDASIELMERNLEAIKKNLENLTVKAPMDGQLNSFDHDVGQTKSRGENLGRIDATNGFRVSARVDQYYLNRVKVGQVAKVPISGKLYNMTVNKVLPTISNNQFEILLSFQDSVLPDIRRGQNVQVRLELSAKSKSLMVAKGGFFQSTAGKYVFVLADDVTAIKREVTLGAQNPKFIQVINGLEEGETIITSSYSAFGDAEEILIKKD